MAKKHPPRPKIKKARHFVREWREYRDMKQEELAERIGKTSGAISQLENGIVNYTQPTLEALAKAFGCSPGDVLSVNPLATPPRPELAILMERAAGMPDTMLSHLIGLMPKADQAVLPLPEPGPASSRPTPAKEKSG